MIEFRDVRYLNLNLFKTEYPCLGERQELNEESVTLLGVKIGNNPVKMMDRNFESITTKIEHSSGSLENEKQYFAVEDTLGYIAMHLTIYALHGRNT